ncbi:hypothetical protein LC593_20585 [Nostoc sp. CHAB 5844]|nr:hypothetical protein [Nostoc sp. CHAB 5844]
MNHREKLIQIYQNISELENHQIQLPEEYQNYVAEVAQKCFVRKAVYTVLITLLVHKIIHPSQDIRYHQAEMTGGFSGRSIDTESILNFIEEYSKLIQSDNEIQKIHKEKWNEILGRLMIDE